jgi:DNA-binding NarL/FixJ family response regulator
MAIQAEPPHTVVTVGVLPAVADVPASERLMAGSFTFHRSLPHGRALGHAVAAHRPSWLVVGTGLDEDAQIYVLHITRMISPDLRVAVLGPEDDLSMCDRWMRRGCAAYLHLATPVDRLVRVLELAQAVGIVIVDGCFLRARLQQHVQPATVLTRRERQVLRLVSSGLRNAEVARELHVSPRTAEFHVRNLFEKLGARNRVEAVERGRLLLEY